MKASETKSAEGRLSIRVRPHQKSVITRAAQKVVSEESTLAVPHIDWEAFCNALDTPPKPSAALRRLLAAKAPADLDGRLT